MTPKPLPLDETRLSIEDGDTRIERTILGAGTRVLTQTIPATKSAGVSLWVPVGSRDEGSRTAGSTHFLEHLLFKGTNKRSALDIAVAFDSVGGESNAETAREHTAYWARVRDADLDMAIETLADMVTDSRLDEDDFAMERGVILAELATRLRKPFTRPSSWPSTATVPLAVPSAAPPRRFARSAALTCGSTTSPTTRPPRLSSQPPATSTTTTSSSASRPPWRHPPGITRARPRPGLVDQRPRRPSPTTRRTSRDSATSRRRTSSSVVKACRPLIRWVPR